jgi:Virulence protein RhuM family
MKKVASKAKVLSKNNLVIYQAKSGALELRGDTARETLWVTQVQIVEVSGIDRSLVTKHTRNIYKEKELGGNSTSTKFALVQSEGNHLITREIEHYNLEVIIAVGYRINSVMGTKFRQWATKTLIFARERLDGNIEAILGNVMQSFSSKDVYLTLEEKAAHLLYFKELHHEILL